MSAERTVGDKGKVYGPGQTVDLPNDRAARLIELGYVVKAGEKRQTNKPAIYDAGPVRAPDRRHSLSAVGFRHVVRYRVQRP